MKEIIGKIKFLVAPMFDGFMNEKDTEGYFVGVAVNGFSWDCKLSEITEEFAAELVDGCEDGFGNYLNAQLKWFDSAKESLISLLKANGCLTKEMLLDGKQFNAMVFDEAGCMGKTDVAFRWNKNKETIDNKKISFIKIEDYPDDFLIIKL